MAWQRVSCSLQLRSWVPKLTAKKLLFGSMTSSLLTWNLKRLTAGI